ncbi:putative hydrolase nit2 [Cytospora mali]|uniref:Hydrolase nit2 n=1 Tax=Cytospora mali TaxID=578113 RepID=A0A194VSZ9_CYTMA|nr:putative hydrolase nit2 [Valsa mali]
MAIAAVGQICSTSSMTHNLDQCVKLMSKAAEAGAKAAAKQFGVHVHVGIHVPIPVKPSSPPANNDTGTTTTTTTTTTKLLNRTIWILPTGEIDPTRNYDKLHLFDYANLRESAHTQAGPSLTPPFDTPVGRVGSLICFDLRFPEPATALAHPSPSSGWGPAQVLTYPSAFTVPTGRAHWEVLLRARAIEAQCWVVAAAQAGWHSGVEGRGRLGG